MSHTHTVIVILEAKPGEVQNLKQLLENVIEPSRAESNNIEYRLHQDINNPAQFILYETWKSAAAHQLQFQKPYIISLIEKINTLLAKPYQVHFAKEI